MIKRIASVLFPEETTMATFTGFPADTLTFLGELEANNNRDWFQENKERYEETV